MNWNIAYKRMDVRKPQYDIVIRGILIEHIDFNNDNVIDTIQQIEFQNRSKVHKMIMPPEETQGKYTPSIDQLFFHT